MAEMSLGSYLIMAAMWLIVIFGWWVCWTDHSNRKKKEPNDGA
jgi:ABC-type nickel/cobalt efflux system permease component RcnA